MNIRIYVAGPMSQGWLPTHIREAVAAAHELRRAGFYPFVPQLCTFWDLIQPGDYEAWLDYDFEWLSACHALLRLPGESKGADREVKFAEEHGIPVFHFIGDVISYFAKERVA